MLHVSNEFVTIVQLSLKKIYIVTTTCNCFVEPPVERELQQLITARVIRYATIDFYHVTGLKRNSSFFIIKIDIIKIDILYKFVVLDLQLLLLLAQGIVRIIMFVLPLQSVS